MHFDEFLREACGPIDLDWRKYRRKAARRRVLERVRQLGLAGLDDYLHYLRSNPLEAQGLADLMRVTVSRFFRDRECWEALGDTVLPSLLSGGPARAVKALSAGACGGEEPYTLAILWKERIEPRFPGVYLELTAWEIDDASIERAKKAAYLPSALKEVPLQSRERWFSKEGSLFVLDQNIREMVRIEKRNMMKDPIPRGVDILLCRYLVFTYYLGKRRKEAVGRLWRSISDQGVLMIGRREQLTQEEEESFRSWRGLPCLYVKDPNRPP